MTKDEARKELLETLEEYCHDKGYNLQVFVAGLVNLVYTLYPLKKTMTNREWLASLSDEQLAEFLYAIQDYPSCEYCGYDSTRSCAINQDCLGGMEKWLKQEHKENGDD